VINASLVRTSGIGHRAAALLRTRWLVRAPIWLYRARLGFVFRSRLLMLEHRGRNTGARRYVVLEIVGHPAPGSYVVVSGFGDRAQWYRNICADSRVGVQVGSRKPAAAIARRLNPEEAAATLASYAASHPCAWAHYGPCSRARSGPRSTKTEPVCPWWFSMRQSGIRLGTSPPVSSDR
jgi:deazaflavin-dependent oxidoreductase (nitroreductase family)